MLFLLGTWIVALLPVIVVVLLVVFAMIVIRRTQRRADQRLELDRQKTSLLQKELEDINTRLTTIEAMLKQVE